MELDLTTATLITMFLGEDLLAWLVLALGGALFVGNVLAVIRPPAPPGSTPGSPGRAGPDRGDETVAGPRAPVARSLIMGGVGLVAAIWALGSLITG